jgi:hypothetical protein
MPRIVVRMKPLGSLSPGVISFANTPATKPMRIVHKIPIPSLLKVTTQFPRLAMGDHDEMTLLSARKLCFRREMALWSVLVHCVGEFAAKPREEFVSR